MKERLAFSFTAPTPSYPLFFEEGLLSHMEWVKELDLSVDNFAVITDETVGPLYGKPIVDMLIKKGYRAQYFTFPSGEAFKNRRIKEKIENGLLRSGWGRECCVIGVGGGVVTDMAGFLASTYCRGVPFISVPTSLLAMADACIGGKTGVNTSLGKNLIGTLYHPIAIVIDPLTLKSLAVQEIKNGLVEMVKHGLVFDSAYFDFLETRLEALKEGNLCYLREAILQSCRIKKEIVQADMNEGKRHILNFGHTVGHALEAHMRYLLPHGSAVALGMIVEGYLSYMLGHLPGGDLERIRLLIERLDMERRSLKFTSKNMLKHMVYDKKNRRQKPHFVLLSGIGEVLECGGRFCSDVEESLILNALASCLGKKVVIDSE